jgi:hypothetical protein
LQQNNFKNQLKAKLTIHTFAIVKLQKQKPGGYFSLANIFPKTGSTWSRMNLTNRSKQQNSLLVIDQRWAVLVTA